MQPGRPEILAFTEEYMSANQLFYFSEVLLSKRRELLAAIGSLNQQLQEEQQRQSDTLDWSGAQQVIRQRIENCNRKQRALNEIDRALRRIEDGEYGYCAITGEEIGIKRLLANPTASLCVDVQERMERLQQFTACDTRIAQ